MGQGDLESTDQILTSLKAGQHNLLMQYNEKDTVQPMMYPYSKKKKKKLNLIFYNLTACSQKTEEPLKHHHKDAIMKFRMKQILHDKESNFFNK